MGTDGRTDMTKLIVSLRNFASAPNKPIKVKECSIVCMVSVRCVILPSPEPIQIWKLTLKNYIMYAVLSAILYQPGLCFGSMLLYFYNGKTILCGPSHVTELKLHF